MCACLRPLPPCLRGVFARVLPTHGASAAAVGGAALPAEELLYSGQLSAAADAGVDPEVRARRDASRYLLYHGSTCE